MIRTGYLSLAHCTVLGRLPVVLEGVTAQYEPVPIISSRRNCMEVRSVRFLYSTDIDITDHVWWSNHTTM